MTNEIGWHFPSNGGGLEDGYNDPGIATFAGSPLPSLAREILQNSLDASRSDLKEPVDVSFELFKFKREQEIGRAELDAALRSSLKAAAKDPKEHQQAISSAIKLLEQQKLTFLRISDSNTTGLQGDNWHALVKLQGSSRKDNPGAGGSHGIGKYAAFAVSPLRTVFYWTCFEENGKQIEKFQGKSVLRSHEGPEKELTRGTGFFGIKKNCRELCDTEIPHHFRILREGNRPVRGTGLWIAGFQGDDGWQRGIAESIIENFFYAISIGKLTITLEPNSEMEDRGLLDMNESSLDKWFDWIQEHASDSEENGGAELEEARKFSELTRSQPPTAETEDTDLGHCRLWIQTGDGLPSKVALVRATGMLITTEQKGLIRFRDLRDFAAVCVFESSKGNELLRKMENPKHDKFEPDRLPEDERAKGKRALNRIVKWIRAQIEDKAKPPQAKQVTVLAELARILPDIEPDEKFGSTSAGGGGGGRGREEF